MVIKRVIKICIVLLVTGLFCLSFATLGAVTESYFTDQALISGNSFQTGDWQKPESQAGPLDEYQTENDFQIPYTAWDNLAGVSEIALWYRYEGGVWTYYDTQFINPSQTNISGDFDFIALCGDGFYEFYTIAKDQQDNTENPPYVADASTTVDTEDPVTTISIGEPKYEGSLRITSATLIELSAFDATSGLDWTKYIIDTNAWQNYVGPFTLSGLPDGPHLISYHSKDNAGNIEMVKFLLVILDNQGPIISNVQAINITTNSATIIWNTDEGATSSVEYGLDTFYGNLTPEDSNLVTSHSVNLSGLTPNTLYHFRVKSKDALGNEAISGDYIFTTLAEDGGPVGHIVINEVYYDVGSRTYSNGTKTEREGYNEWIELYNPSNFDISIKDYKVGNSSKEFTINANISIPAKGYALLSHDNDTWHFWNEPNVQKINLGGKVGFGWLKNNGDQLILKDNLGTEIDFVAWEGYITGWNLKTSPGESIARKIKGFDTDSPSDWEVLTVPNPGTNPHSQGNISELTQQIKEKVDNFVDNTQKDNSDSQNSDSQSEDTTDNKTSDSSEENDSQEDSQANNSSGEPIKFKEESSNLPDEKNDNQNVEGATEINRE